MGSCARCDWDTARAARKRYLVRAERDNPTCVFNTGFDWLWRARVEAGWWVRQGYRTQIIERRKRGGA